MWLKTILHVGNQRIHKEVVAKGLVYFLLAYGWFAILYPELLFLPDTCEMVEVTSEDRNGEQSPLVIKMGYAKDVQYLIERLQSRLDKKD